MSSNYQAPSLIKVDVASDQVFAAYGCVPRVTWIMQGGVCDSSQGVEPAVRMGAGTSDCYTDVM